MLTMFIHTSAALTVACGVLGYLLHRTRRHLADADLAVEQLENELEAYRDFEDEGPVDWSRWTLELDLGLEDLEDDETPSTWPEGQ